LSLRTRKTLFDFFLTDHRVLDKDPSHASASRLCIIRLMGPYNYVVSAQKPTAVSYSVKGNFLSSTEQCLIVRYITVTTKPRINWNDLTNTDDSKGSRIEIFRVNGEKLKLALDFNIWGRVSSIQLYQPSVISDLIVIGCNHQFI
jgi:hypothetical protein